MGYLADDAFEFPADLLVEFLDLLGALGGGLELVAEVGFEDAREEAHPGRDALGLGQEVGRDHELKVNHAEITLLAE